MLAAALAHPRGGLLWSPWVWSHSDRARGRAGPSDATTCLVLGSHVTAHLAGAGPLLSLSHPGGCGCLAVCTDACGILHLSSLGGDTVPVYQWRGSVVPLPVCVGSAQSRCSFTICWPPCREDPCGSFQATHVCWGSARAPLTGAFGSLTLPVITSVTEAVSPPQTAPDAPWAPCCLPLSRAALASF